MTNDCKLQIALLAVTCGLAAGCSSGIETGYGQRKEIGASTSVNGAAVLGEMFQRAGHKVFSWRVLSPRLMQRADCIVWFPDDFQPPGEEVRDWLENWLLTEPGRTLIYVGRDFDAAGWYWDKVKPDVPPDQLPMLRREMTEAKSDFNVARSSIPKSEDCDWFTVEDKRKPRKVRTLSGRPEWLEGIDASQLEIELRSRVLPADTAEVLLRSDGDLLISREQWDQSQLIVVANGSFLLNLPLVNHQHRKLAGKLIDQVGSPAKTVVFLESHAGGPPISAQDPSAEVPTGMEIFNVWPTNWILFHLALVGILFCFSRLPIFGRPRQPVAESTSDFGKHVRALAELLERSRDRAYAMTRVLHYQQTTKRSE